MKWIPCRRDRYISDKRLAYEKKSILVTYETMTGRRYTEKVYCEFGRVATGKLNGTIIAWMPLPEPYQGENECLISGE